MLLQCLCCYIVVVLLSPLWCCLHRHIVVVFVAISSLTTFVAMTLHKLCASLSPLYHHLQPMHKTSTICHHTQTSTPHHRRQQHQAMHPEGCKCMQEGQEWGTQIACL